MKTKGLATDLKELSPTLVSILDQQRWTDKRWSKKCLLHNDALRCEPVSGQWLLMLTFFSCTHLCIHLGEFGHIHTPMKPSPYQVSKSIYHFQNFPRVLLCRVCVCVCVCLYVVCWKYLKWYLFSWHIYIYFWRHCTTCGILVPQPWIKPAPPAVEALSLYHWTANEVS